MGQWLGERGVVRGSYIATTIARWFSDVIEVELSSDSMTEETFCDLENKGWNMESNGSGDYARKTCRQEEYASVRKEADRFIDEVKRLPVHGNYIVRVPGYVFSPQNIYVQLVPQ